MIPSYMTLEFLHNPLPEFNVILQCSHLETLRQESRYYRDTLRNFSSNNIFWCRVCVCVSHLSRALSQMLRLAADTPSVAAHAAANATRSPRVCTRFHSSEQIFSSAIGGRAPHSLDRVCNIICTNCQAVAVAFKALETRLQLSRSCGPVFSFDRCEKKKGRKEKTVFRIEPSARHATTCPASALRNNMRCGR